MKHSSTLVERIRRDARSMGLSVTGASARALSEYAALLATRAVDLGLVARSDRGRIYQRHVADSLRAVALIGPGDRTAYDLGSGAGLPGVVVAVMAPWCRVLLVEPRRLRVAFLEMVLERLDVPNADIAATRVEHLHAPADVVLARAFAPLRRTWKVAGPLLHPGGRLIYFAGETLVTPVEEAHAAARKGLPATVATTSVLATFSPLVIMTRT